MNQSLDTSRVVFILGAGASVPLGVPTTVGLRKALCDATPEGRAAAEIHQSAAYRFRVPEDAVNIEDFLEHLYELQLLLWLARRSSLPQLLPDFTANSPVPAMADDMLRNVQRRAYQLLHDRCGDCSGRKVDTLWRPILKCFSLRQSVVPMFTLNYDWTFEKLAIEAMNRYRLIDGFELLGGAWDAGRFSDINPVPGKTNVVLFKLHGSTNWLPGGPVKSMGSFQPDTESEDDGYPPHQFEMIYPGHAHESWFGDEYWGRLNDSAGMFDPWTEREPYKTLHSHLHELTQRAELIVVIGYAFHDKRVNYELAAAVNTNERVRVLVVDPGIRRYLKSSETTHQDAPFEFLKLGPLDFRWSGFTWLAGKFGDKHVTAELIRAISAV